MTHSAKIITDSISPNGVRLTTMEVVFPRIVLAEFNTHRMFTRNSASSRAIPVEKMIRMVQEHPYIPTHWGKNQMGMQAEQELSESQILHAACGWRRALEAALHEAQVLQNTGLHKQITNRLLEPFMWHTCIVTATEWSNFVNLRANPAAHPEIRLAAELMRDAMAASEPRAVNYDEWHLPYIDRDENFDLEVGPDAEYHFKGELTRKVSVARCARVSYLTHDGRRDPEEDIGLHGRLLGNGHMSPFEHVARPMTGDELRAYSRRMDAVDHAHGTHIAAAPFCGNFRGWLQYRKLIPNEHDILGAR